MKERENLDQELEVLSLELRRLPTPMPKAALVSRVRTLGHLEIAERAEARLNRLLLAFLLLFSWTVSLFAFRAVSLLGGPSWSVAYSASAWISGAAVLVLLGLHARKERTLV